MAGMFAYGSFIAKKADVTNSAFITSFSNCATSFFAGFAVFSIVGFIMQAMNVESAMLVLQAWAWLSSPTQRQSL
jgi:NSS family neurotransmitter:Na+ symporter